MSTFNRIERRILSALLAGDHPALMTLRAQFDEAQVERRERRNGALRLILSVPADVPRLVGAWLVAITDTRIERRSGADRLAAAVLWMSDGALAHLGLPDWEEFQVDDSDTVIVGYFAPDGPAGNEGQKLIAVDDRDLAFFARRYETMCAGHGPRH